MFDEIQGRGSSTSGIGRAAGAAAAPTADVADILHLIGAGATGRILMALGRGSLRTRRLTEQVRGFAPRTVYRHASRLAENGLVVRRDEGTVPSAVTYSLSDRGGRELVELIRRYTISAAYERSSPDGEPWPLLVLLGDMWGSGWIAALAEEPCTPTELSELTPGMSFHQVNRRVQLLRSRGLLSEVPHSGRGKRYRLTPTARRTLALVVGIARWRETQGLPGKQSGLTVSEMVTVLQTVLPLLRLPQHGEKQIKLGIVGAADETGSRGSGVVLVKCSGDGSICFGDDSDGPARAWAAGTIDVWLAALVDGNRGRMRVGGEMDLVDACLRALFEALWPKTGG